MKVCCRLQKVQSVPGLLSGIVVSDCVVDANKQVVGKNSGLL